MVSIIIPIYNVENYIAATLHSVFGQSYTDIECLLVNDCTTDNSIAIAQELIHATGNESRSRIIHQPKNSGAAAARNTGINEAKGEYIYFLDADDTLNPNCISKLVEAIEHTQADFAVANIQLVGMRSVHTRPFNLPMDQTQPLRYFLSGEMLPSPCNKLIKRQFLLKHKLLFVNGLLHEDILWAYQLYSSAQKFVPIADTTYNYIAHNSSSSRKANSQQRIESLLYILGELNNDFQKSTITPTLHDSFLRFYDSWRFITALLLTNYEGSRKDAKQHYKNLQALRLNHKATLKGRILKLNYTLFVAFIKPIYALYRVWQ